MSRYQLAQLNIGVMRAPLDSPVMADFVASLDRINALADAAPGFIWRFQTADGNATGVRPLGDTTLVNLSVWEDAAALNEYVYRSGHVAIMRRRKEWFERMAEAYMVLWWVPAGERPTVAAALDRLEALKQHGPTAAAFTLRQLFPPPDAPNVAQPLGFDTACPA